MHTHTHTHAHTHQRQQLMVTNVHHCVSTGFMTSVAFHRVPKALFSSLIKSRIWCIERDCNKLLILQFGGGRTVSWNLIPPRISTSCGPSLVPRPIHPGWPFYSLCIILHTWGQNAFLFYDHSAPLTRNTVWYVARPFLPSSPNIKWPPKGRWLWVQDYCAPAFSFLCTYVYTCTTIK